jgi:hypothetical protein
MGETGTGVLMVFKQMALGSFFTVSLITEKCFLLAKLGKAVVFEGEFYTFIKSGIIIKVSSFDKNKMIWKH